MSEWLTATEAVERLGIALQTLYAYVSRGLVHSHPGTPGHRQRLYSGDDVQRLVQRRETRRDPSRATREALHWGAPLLDSEITLIDSGRLFYRGLDATELARTATVEEVASLLWTGDASAHPSLFETSLPRLPSLPAAPMIPSMQMAVTALSVSDLSAFDLRPASVAAHGARILLLLTRLAAGNGIARSRPGIAAGLAAGWNVAPTGKVLSAALILCADHELNISSFTARCAASAGANPYQVVVAGLAAVQGVRHGGLSIRVEALFDEVGSPGNASGVIASRLQRGEQIPGFGSPLYPDGDPRGRALLEIVRKARPASRQWKLIDAIQDSAQRIVGEHPTIDFALVAVERILALSNSSALTLFALGRTLGWIGHAIEQYAVPGTIRPRARYIGKMPDSNLALRS